MPQFADVQTTTTKYFRADVTAIRAYLNRIPIGTIASLYYSEDDLERLGCTTNEALRARLDELRDSLIDRACQINPHVASVLSDARQSGRWSPRVQQFLVDAPDAFTERPKPSDPLSLWFKRRVVEALNEAGATTIAELIHLITTRGHLWWMPIPRFGLLKARSLEKWLLEKAGDLGEIACVVDERTTDSCGALIPLDIGEAAKLNLDQVKLPQGLEGRDGLNRRNGYRLLRAENDVMAVRAYLMTLMDSPHQYRAYAKEIKRFLLWCWLIKKQPLSSILVDDCSEFLQFLANPPADWICGNGKKARPFKKPLSPKSQHYAYIVLSTMFSWFQNGMYLNGNPWKMVKVKGIKKEVTAIKVDKAWPEELYEKLVGAGGIFESLIVLGDDVLRERYRFRGSAARMSLCAQLRSVRAALLLMGDAGIRREELRTSSRNQLKLVQSSPPLWELSVLGKGNKLRTTVVTERAVCAIRAHWDDRRSAGEVLDDFEFGMQEVPLLAPIEQFPTHQDMAQLAEVATTLPFPTRPVWLATNNGAQRRYSSDGIYKLVTRMLKRISSDEELSLTMEERHIIKTTTPHSMRHTYATTYVNSDVPIDVVQGMLGHVSINTTMQYVKEDADRRRKSVTQFLAKRKPAE